MVDQEGGQVKRLAGPPSASAAEMGARGAEFAREQGRRTGRSLRRLGIGIDLAPVLDVGRPGGAIAGEGRSFGSSAAAVTRTGVDGFAAGLADSGVAATAKHFPGLGTVATNTDSASQRVGLSRRQLRVLDERAIRSLLEGGG